MGTTQASGAKDGQGVFQVPDFSHSPLSLFFTAVCAFNSVWLLSSKWNLPILPVPSVLGREGWGRERDSCPSGNQKFDFNTFLNFSNTIFLNSPKIFGNS